MSNFLLGWVMGMFMSLIMIIINDPEPNVEYIEVPVYIEAPSEEEPQPSQPEESRAYREIEAIVTAYCPCNICCGEYADGKTATGTSAWRLGIAVDPRVIPYGSMILIPGEPRELPADDTGGAMRQATNRGECHIDFRMTDHYSARQYGRKRLRIKVYEQ